MLLFTWLSRKPGNSVIYYPNRILKGLDPWEGGKRTRNPFAWIHEAISSTEEDVVSISGVDSAVYFVFLSTGLSFSFSRMCLFCRNLPGFGRFCTILFNCGFQAVFLLYFGGFLLLSFGFLVDSHKKAF